MLSASRFLTMQPVCSTYVVGGWGFMSGLITGEEDFILSETSNYWNELKHKQRDSFSEGILRCISLRLLMEMRKKASSPWCSSAAAGAHIPERPKSAARREESSNSLWLGKERLLKSSWFSKIQKGWLKNGEKSAGGRQSVGSQWAHMARTHQRP